jgi:hypothetical protein
VGAWALETGRGLVGPAGAQTTVVTTGEDGRYAIGAAAPPSDPRVRVARFTLLVHHPGYLVYRSDRRFPSLARRHDFVQRGAEIALEHRRDDVDRRRYLAFVGAGGPIGAAVAGEMAQPAPASPAPAPVAEPAVAAAPIDPTVLLSVDELKAVTGYDGAFDTERLGDLPSSPTYGSLHFRARGKSEKFDAAVRVFHPATVEAAERQYEELLRELPAAGVADEVGDRSLRTREGDLLGVAALDRAHRFVLLFTCGEALCGDVDRVAALVKRMHARIGRLERPAAGR